MLLDGFKLEVRVNKKQLDEYNLLESSLDSNFSSALKSHVYMKEEERKNICEFATFVAIPEPGTRYEIYFMADKATKNNPIKAIIYIDGKNDDSYYTIPDNRTKKKSSFYNEDFTKKHKFIFDNTEWVEEKVYNNDFEKMKYGGLGVISIYFYKGKYKKRTKEHRANASEKGFERTTKVPETKKCIDITYTTKFDEGKVTSYRPKETKLVKADKEPLAVLHINYRPVDWFIAKGISIHLPSELVGYEQVKLEVDNIIKQEHSQDPIIIISDDDSNEIIRGSNKKREITEDTELFEYKQVKLDVYGVTKQEYSQDPLTITSDNDSNEAIKIISKKRKITEVIEIFDSDDE